MKFCQKRKNDIFTASLKTARNLNKKKLLRPRISGKDGQFVGRKQAFEGETNGTSIRVGVAF